MLLLYLFLSVFLTTGFSLAGGEGISRISIILEEKAVVEPDIFILPVNTDVSGQKEAEVITILGELDKKIRSLGVDYFGGRYSVYKNCWWEKEKMRCSGYRGNISYQFRLKEPVEQNQILELLQLIKEKYGEKISYTISTPSWEVSDTTVDIKKDSLRLKIIDSALTFSKKAGEKIGKQCKIHKIDYDHPRPSFMRGYVVEQAKTLEAPEPKREIDIITVKAYVELVCR